MCVCSVCVGEVDARGGEEHPAQFRAPGGRERETTGERARLTARSYILAVHIIPTLPGTVRMRKTKVRGRFVCVSTNFHEHVI